MTPFRGEKNTNWEGGWRVPAMVRWPGKIQAGSVTNEIVHHMDWLPTFLAAAGEPDIKNQLKQGGVEAIGRTYKVHLDGYNILPLLTGATDKSPCKEIFYFSDDGDLTALRYADWKLIFMEQKAPGTFRIWMEPFVPLRVPLMFNLRRDPYERAKITSNTLNGFINSDKPEKGKRHETASSDGHHAGCFTGACAAGGGSRTAAILERGRSHTLRRRIRAARHHGRRR